MLLAVVVAVQLVAFGPQIVGGRCLSGADLLFEFPPFDSPATNGGGPSHANSALGDPAFHIEPWLDEASRQVRRGEIPLWNPCQFAGAPLHGNYEAALCYPPQWLHFVLPPGRATLPIAFLELVVAGFFTALFARRRGLGMAPSAFAGIAFSLLPWLNFHLLWPLGSVGSLLPVSMFAADVLATAPSIAAAVGLAVAFALELLAGHPETAVHVGVFTTIWFAWRLIPAVRRVEERRLAWCAMAAFAGAAVAAILLAAVQILPFADYLFDSAAWKTRVESATHAAIGTTIGWRCSTLVLPHLFGDPARGTYWGGIAFTSIVTYVGVPTLVLAAASLASWRTRRDVRFFAIAALVIFSIALDPPLVHDAIRAIPVLGVVPLDRLKLVSGFCLAISGACGLDHLLRCGGEGRSRLRAFAVGGSVAALALCGVAVIANRQALSEHGGVASLAPQLLGFGAFLAASCALVLLPAGRTRFVVAAGAPVLVALDLLPIAMPWHPSLEPSRRYPETPAIRFLEQQPGPFRIAAAGMTLPPNVATAYGLEDVRGHDAMTPSRFDLLMRRLDPAGRDPLRRRMSEAMEATATEYFESGDHALLKQFERPIDRARIERLRDEWLESGMPPREFLRTKPTRVSRGVLLQDCSSPVLDLLGVKWVVAPANESGATALDASRFRLAFDGEARIYENLNAFPRAFLVGEVEIASSPDDAVDRLLRPGFDARRCAVLETTPEPAPRTGGSARIDVRTASSLVVVTESNGPSLLVVSDSFLASGLRADVDGRDAEVLAADGALRAVAVPEGTHRVTVAYAPASVRTGCLLSVGSAAFLALAMVVGGRRRR
ncbi:MAG: hypothetical protein HY292_14545 [Planctomycetes bacterium]|nr:hypothetical protein [Planctomycetota bacterium]